MLSFILKDEEDAKAAAAGRPGLLSSKSQPSAPAPRMAPSIGLNINVDRDKTPPRRFPMAGGAQHQQPQQGGGSRNPAYQNLQDPPTPSGRLIDRIERLRLKCIEALGRDAFNDAYSFLKQCEEVCIEIACNCLISSQNSIFVFI